MDLSCPGNLNKVGSAATRGNPAYPAVAVTRDYAFVADQSNGLYVFNISNPDSLTRYGPFGGAGAMDVAVRGNFAYLAHGAGSVQMMDITTPSSPATVLSFSTPTPATRIAVNRESLYVLGTNVIYAYNLMQ